MDCCHSATGTRDPKVKVRQAQAPINSQRTLDSFIFAQDKAALNQFLSNETTDVEWLKAKHIVLAACRADQVAEECRDKDGKDRGVFSYFLLETLQKTNGNLTYQMEQVNSRQIKKSPGGNYDDWMTKKVTLTYVRPQDAKLLKQSESTTLLDGVVELQPHPGLQAKANLITVPQITRDVTNPVLPPILTQDPTVSQPFQFTTSRGSDPGLSVLELTEVQNYTSITPETPLKLLVNTTLGENEHILPLAYDGEFYVPLGRGVKTGDGKTEILLAHLPSPTNSSRSVSGSVKILFQKLVTQTLGAPFEYPILAIADIGEDGKLIPNSGNKKLENVRAKVAQSQKILLYIHGIIGDTESLVSSVQKTKIGEQSINELYDLVLTFDYENLNTSIQKNAQLLRQRLEAVGLEPNHGKELHVIAHSMGGLVSRWFIEREGGNEIVQHLIMLGTPNAGSPWSKPGFLTNEKKSLI